MKHYFAFVHKGPNGWGITVPDCPGLTAESDTFDQATVAGAQALRLWSEAELSAGRDLPAPRDADEILNDPDFIEDISDNAVVASLPLLVDAGRTLRINISMDAGLVGALDETAKDRGITRSGFIASAVREKIIG